MKFELQALINGKWVTFAWSNKAAPMVALSGTRKDRRVLYRRVF